MSAPDGGIRHYAAGYEILADGHPRWWGQRAVSVGSGVGDPPGDDPQALLQHICVLAARRHEATPAQVRLLMLVRL